MIGVKLYRNSTIETINQDDERVLTQKQKISSEHLAEMEEMKGKTVTGEILFFPEDGFYPYNKCSTCKTTTPLKDKMEDICSSDGCGGNLKSCYKVDIKFINNKTSEVIHLTGFDEVFSPYERKSGQKNGQPLEGRFKKLMGRPLTLFYKTSLKRNASGEPSLYIDSIKLMD